MSLRQRAGVRSGVAMPIWFSDVYSSLAGKEPVATAASQFRPFEGLRMDG
jgi:hypothetical protein